jgi:hypothetical protein
MHGSHCYSDAGVLACGYPDQHGNVLTVDVAPSDMTATDDTWSDTRATDWSDATFTDQYPLTAAGLRRLAITHPDAIR